jgi:hypothetical protein
MMPSIESASIFSSGLVPDPGRSARGPTALGKMSAYTAVVLARVRDLAPYAALELVLPGGSLMALLLWLYRRHKKDLALPND